MRSTMLTTGLASILGLLMISTPAGAQGPYGRHGPVPRGPVRAPWPGSFGDGYAPIAPRALPPVDPYVGRHDPGYRFEYHPGYGFEYGYGDAHGSLVALADQLVGQADEFLHAFSYSAAIVPEGRRFLNDARSLRDAAFHLRQAAAFGTHSGQVVAAFRQVELRWRRLESRMLRVSRGRIGPNIATALEMGRTVEQMRYWIP